MPSPESDFVLIAANPRSGRSYRDRHLKELADWLAEHGQTVKITGELDRAEQFANELHRQGRLTALVSAGGDGTLAELANRTMPGVPLAPYPAGTANLVARYLKISAATERFGQMILDRQTVPIDAGRANGRLFLAVCSCGFDAEVVRRVHAARTGHISTFTYFAPIIKAVRAYAFPELRIYAETPDEERPSADPITARWAFVSNLPCYAGGLKPGAGASGSDGQLDLCALRYGGLLPALRYLPYMLTGRQSRLPDCNIARAPHFHIESDTPVPYELDGDPGGLLPVTIDILPHRLTLLARNQPPSPPSEQTTHS